LKLEIQSRRLQANPDGNGNKKKVISCVSITILSKSPFFYCIGQQE